MMKKPDRITDAFKRRAAAAFARALDRSRAKDHLSVEQFAHKLGITRAGLYKILGGKTVPSLRVLRNARRFFGVQLNYGELGGSYTKAKKEDPRQVRLQFSVGDISTERIEVRKFSPAGENSLELVIRIDLSKAG